ncbi:hypothetical protein [Amycolatopsis sp. RTGN1]|uniref:hypothetical protein n=1 Tax=Amycolatopsis ponsaeliensis TaxID=2992142 RepID=UPI00254AEFD9|nr:hypothetical protein [Amycolatopsis sp. RTGN1]
MLSLWEKGQHLPSVEDGSAILALLGMTGEKRDPGPRGSADRLGAPEPRAASFQPVEPDDVGQVGLVGSVEEDGAQPGERGRGEQLPEGQDPGHSGARDARIQHGLDEVHPPESVCGRNLSR